MNEPTMIPFSALFGQQEDDGPKPHPLLPEAQRANLEEAWSHYVTPKTFKPGDVVRCRQGLSQFNDEPVVMIYVRKIDEDVYADVHIMDVEHERNRWNKVDCMVMRTYATGTVVFIPFDSDTLEHVDAAVE